MNALSVVVLGSLHYDIFIESNTIPKIGETVLGRKWYPKLGGKGANQAKAIAKSGTAVKFISAIGNDFFSEFLLRELKKYKINLEFIQKKQMNSGMSVAVSNRDGDYSATVVSGANLNISRSTFNDESLWLNSKYLHLQNEITEEINIYAALEAKKRNLTVLLNAAPAKDINKDLKFLIDILIVNEVEAIQLINDETKNLVEISKKLSDEFPLVIITAGSKGITYCKKGEEPTSIPSIKVKVQNTHGAGDYFIGTLCANLISGKSISNAINFANQMAANFVSK